MMHRPRDRTGKNTADFEAYFSELEEIQQASKLSESNGSNSCTDGEDEDAMCKTPEGEQDTNSFILDLNALTSSSRHLRG